MERENRYVQTWSQGILVDLPFSKYEDPQVLKVRSEWERKAMGQDLFLSGSPEVEIGEIYFRKTYHATIKQKVKPCDPLDPECQGYCQKCMKRFQCVTQSEKIVREYDDDDPWP